VRGSTQGPQRPKKFFSEPPRLVSDERGLPQLLMECPGLADDEFCISAPIVERPDAEILREPRVTTEEKLNLPILKWGSGFLEPIDQVVAEAQQMFLQLADIHGAVAGGSMGSDCVCNLQKQRICGVSCAREADGAI